MLPLIQREVVDRKHWIDEKEYNASDIDAFYDYLIEMSNELNNKTKE